MRKGYLLQVTIILSTLLYPTARAADIDSMAEAFAAQAKRCWERGETAHAVKLYKQALDHEVKDDNDELYKALLYNNLGECYRRVADQPSQLSLMEPDEAAREVCLGKAEENLKNALRIKEAKSSSSTNFIYIARSIENLASVYKTQNQTMEAEALYRKAIAIREEKEGKGATSCASDYLAIGEILTTDRHFNEALEALKKSLALYTATSSPNDNVLGICHQKIAYLYLNWNKLALAGDEYDKAVQIFSRNQATARKYLGNLEKSMPDFPLHAYSDACAEVEKIETEASPSIATKRARMAILLKAARRYKRPANEIKFFQDQLIR